MQLTTDGFWFRLMPAFSGEAHDINNFFIQFIYFSAFLIILIGGILVFVSVRFHNRKQIDQPKQITGNTILEILWTVFPLFVVVYFFSVTILSMHHIHKLVPEGNPDIIIMGHQW